MKPIHLDYIIMPLKEAFTFKGILKHKEFILYVGLLLLDYILGTVALMGIDGIVTGLLSNKLITTIIRLGMLVYFLFLFLFGINITIRRLRAIGQPAWLGIIALFVPFGWIGLVGYLLAKDDVNEEVK